MQRQEPEALRPSRVGCEYIVGAASSELHLVFEIDGDTLRIAIPHRGVAALAKSMLDGLAHIEAAKKPN